MVVEELNIMFSASRDLRHSDIPSSLSISVLLDCARMSGAIVMLYACYVATLLRSVHIGMDK
jgi:hypothetical protein